MAVTLAVHVTPKAGRDEVAGWRGHELALRVSVAPEGGKANAAVCALVAKALAVPKSSVSVVRGAASRHKLLAFSSATDADVEAAFGPREASV
jgi:uncharacterized protein YggU (UPF0235/DUF167 family)